MNIPLEDLIVVSIMPCLAKKYECAREEFATQGDPDVNYSLSTRELASLIKRANIDFNSLADEDFDHPLGESTGAGVIFGASGGVMEAALRTAYELYTGKTLDKVDFKEVRGLENIKKATIKLNGVELHVGIAHGLGNARELLNEIRERKIRIPCDRNHGLSRWLYRRRRPTFTSWQFGFIKSPQSGHLSGRRT